MGRKINLFDIGPLCRWALVVGSATLLGLAWVTTALAQAAGDGDGFDGDELSIPIVVGLGVLGYLGWTIYRRRSPKRPS
jgi:hypothetical protein